jgi:hypothetical protein
MVKMLMSVGDSRKDQIIFFQEGKNFPPADAVDGYSLRVSINKISQIVTMTELFNIQHLNSFSYGSADNTFSLPVVRLVICAMVL